MVVIFHFRNKIGNKGESKDFFCPAVDTGDRLASYVCPLNNIKYEEELFTGGS